MLTWWRVSQERRRLRLEALRLQNEIDACLRRADELYTAVRREEEAASRPGGIYGTYWVGGWGPERAVERAQAARRWDEMLAEARGLRRKAIELDSVRQTCNTTCIPKHQP